MFTEWVVRPHFCEQYLEGSVLFMLILCVSIRALYHQKFQNLSKYSGENCSDLRPLCPVLCCLPLATLPQTLRKIPNNTCQAKQTWMMCTCCLLCAIWVVLKLLISWLSSLLMSFGIRCFSEQLSFKTHVSRAMFPQNSWKEEEEWHPRGLGFWWKTKAKSLAKIKRGQEGKHSDFSRS